MPALYRVPTGESQHGFTLIELLIVIAIIGILSAAGIAVFISGVKKANEASAVSAINTIKVAETRYAMDHDGHFGTLSQLFKGGYLDKRFNVESPHVHGYVFELSVVDRQSRAAASFQVHANPEVPDGVGATGSFYYYSEPDAGVFFSREGPADSEDELL